MSLHTKEFERREFPMTAENFKQIKSIAYDSTGINLSDHKKEMVYSRLARRVRELGMNDFNQYCHLIENGESCEHSDFINAITTNLTSFYREEHHFDFLEKTVVPELKLKHAKDKQIRVWSAGCSTGEEPYTIAMTLSRQLNLSIWDVKILASDLDSNVVDHARTGVYRKDRVDSLDSTIIKKHFLKGNNEYKIKPTLQEYIVFKRLNLLEPWPMKGKFDVIFCRNVVIYFDKPTQRVLFDRYADMLQPNGYLFIGHSESLHGVTDRFEGKGRTIYQKIN